MLRQATREEHDRLDAKLSPLPLGSPADYRQFLLVQYTARLPIEAWFAAHVEPELSPPPQTPAIAADLEALAIEPIPVEDLFDAEPSNALGAAWVIAGSAMGNRFILKQRKRNGLDGPHQFLSCPLMPTFFQHLLSRLRYTPAANDRDNAVAGAKAVFARFENVANSAFAGHRL